MSIAKEILNRLVKEGKLTVEDEIYSINSFDIWERYTDELEYSHPAFKGQMYCYIGDESGNKNLEILKQLDKGKFLVVPIEFTYNDEYNVKEYGAIRIYDKKINAYREKLIEDIDVLRNYSIYMSDYYSEREIVKKEDIRKEVDNMNDIEILLYIDMINKLNIGQSVIIEL